MAMANLIGLSLYAGIAAKLPLTKSSHCSEMRLDGATCWSEMGTESKHKPLQDTMVSPTQGGTSALHVKSRTGDGCESDELH